MLFVDEHMDENMTREDAENGAGIHLRQVERVMVHEAADRLRNMDP
jgi:hypothetical protein